MNPTESAYHRWILALSKAPVVDRARLDYLEAPCHLAEARYERFRAIQADHPAVEEAFQAWVAQREARRDEAVLDRETENL
jgi:hypothetical protein